jgi:choline dehydrogenase-like flavoprotein
MGDDAGTSVTDANGRFHHVANAYCVDQSLFPTVGSANPVLTGLTLTRKIAEHIAAQAGSDIIDAGYFCASE